MEHIGSFHALLFAPEWFTEGMAYALSEAPPQAFAWTYGRLAQQVRAWYPAVTKEALWDAARRL